jgi:sporulation protein YlmC with PRC-barrel domain
VITKDLFGKEVLDDAANSIGKVAEINFDVNKGTLNHFIVKSGWGKKYNITFDKINKVGDKVILNIKKDQIEKK